MDALETHAAEAYEAIEHKAEWVCLNPDCHEYFSEAEANTATFETGTTAHACPVCGDIDLRKLDPFNTEAPYSWFTNYAQGLMGIIMEINKLPTVAGFCSYSGHVDWLEVRVMQHTIALSPGDDGVKTHLHYVGIMATDSHSKLRDIVHTLLAFHGRAKANPDNPMGDQS